MRIILISATLVLILLEFGCVPEPIINDIPYDNLVKSLRKHDLPTGGLRYLNFLRKYNLTTKEAIDNTPISKALATRAVDLYAQGIKSNYTKSAATARLKQLASKLGVKPKENVLQSIKDGITPENAKTLLLDMYEKSNDFIANDIMSIASKDMWTKAKNNLTEEQIKEVQDITRPLRKLNQD